MIFYCVICFLRVSCVFFVASSSDFLGYIFFLEGRFFWGCRTFFFIFVFLWEFFRWVGFLFGRLFSGGGRGDVRIWRRCGCRV